MITFFNELLQYEYENKILFTRVKQIFIELEAFYNGI